MCDVSICTLDYCEHESCSDCPFAFTKCEGDEIA